MCNENKNLALFDEFLPRRLNAAGRNLASIQGRSGMSPAPLMFALGCFLVLAFAAPSALAGDYRLDPEKVKGPDECGECHKEEVMAWKNTHHANTFKDMPRTDEAREIADKLGIKRIKSESDCLTCHFTMAMDDGMAMPISGISCESCHGAGDDWIDQHADFGGKDVTAENETPEHKAARLAAADAAGMIRPANLYSLAANCYSCHTVPNERLVNVGGHAAGSKFELVRWLQGEVRHNLWYTDENNEASLERRRAMYVVGKMLDLEYGLRGVAKATENADYAVEMAMRAKRALAFLKKIDETVDDPQLTAIIAAGSEAELKLNNETALLSVADTVAEHARAFADANDGSQLAGVDGLLPTPDKYKGDVYTSH